MLYIIIFLLKLLIVIVISPFASFDMIGRLLLALLLWSSKPLNEEHLLYNTLRDTVFGEKN